MTQPNTIQTLSPGDMQRMSRALQWVERQRAELAARPGAAPLPIESVPVRNASGLDVPEGAIVHMNGMNADEVRHEAYRPVVPFFDDFGVASAPIPAGEDGRAWIGGDRTVRLTSAGWTACAVGEWLIATAGAFTAQRGSSRSR